MSHCPKGVASRASPRRAWSRRGRSMPETIGALVLSAIGVTEIAGFTVTASTFAIVGNVVLAATAVGVQLLTSSGKMPEATQQDGQISVRQPRSPRRRNYGRVKVGGVLHFS